MTSIPGAPPEAPRFILQTFGTLRLIGPSHETVLGDGGHQRRRLALLAAVAASMERGRSRDQLLGLFWPDVSQARARHSLDQLVYAIRTSLGADVFAAGNPLRLNDSVVRSDCAVFSKALAGGDLEGAVELYHGRFLDGFYLNDAPEFEQWMDAERRALERSYTEALERLAATAEESNDHITAARWRHKLVEAEPVSSKHATGLIRALMNAGDHTAALQFAQRYESIVRQELGTSVGPEVAALVGEVRQRAKTESVVVRGAPPRELLRESSLQDDSVGDAATDRDRSPPIRLGPRGHRVAWYAVAVAALSSLVIFSLSPRSGQRGGTPVAAAPSIAVLPLTNLSGDPRDAPLADGLSEELIGVLARIDRLRVIARTSAFVFKNSNLNVRQIADSLRVSNVLEGSVQKVGQRLRVQVRLIDASDGSTRWSETYDRELRDILLVQSEIADAIAEELDLRISGGRVTALHRLPTENVAGYEYYLRGVYFWNARGEENLNRSISYFRQAVAADPGFGRAYAALAMSYALLPEYTDSPPPDVVERTRDASRRALAIDSTLAEAHTALGLVLIHAWDYEAAEREYETAIRLSPRYPSAHQWYGELLFHRNQIDSSIAQMRRAQSLDPLSPIISGALGYTLYLAHQDDACVLELRKALELAPSMGLLHTLVAFCLPRNDPMEAIQHAETAVRLDRGLALRQGQLAYVYGVTGNRDKAAPLVQQLRQRAHSAQPQWFPLAVAHIGTGDTDAALDALQRAVDAHEIALSSYSLVNDAMWDKLRADPRFKRLLDEANIARYVKRTRP